MATVPYPRPIRIGTQGRDVLAVKSCLHRLKFGPTMNEKDPTWGKGSAAALIAYLNSIGKPGGSGAYGPETHKVLSLKMNAYEKKLMIATYKKLHAPKPKPSTTRQVAVRAARLVYDHRYSHYYTQDSRRWDGIRRKIRPPSFPTYSDCSSFVTWCYWLDKGRGIDILNHSGWLAGYTGTLTNGGHRVDLNSMQPGDLVFYGFPIGHVAMYIGGGRVISHGHDPVGLYPVHYRGDLNHARSYV